MAKLVWDQDGERLFETGVEKVVLYPWDSTNNTYGQGVAWNGVTAITESPSGAEPTALYADDIKYLNLMSAEEFSATIEAYTYPDEFAECDGSKQVVTGMTIHQQPRKKFGLCYVTRLGNDVEGSEYSYKIHIIYNCIASPSEANYATINDSPEAITFSWEVSTTPVDVTDGKPTANVTIDASQFTASTLTKLTTLETTLYGGTGANENPTLPLPDDIKRDLT